MSASVSTAPSSNTTDYTYNCISNLNVNDTNCAHDCLGIYECDACPCVVELTSSTGSGPGGDVVDVLLCLLPIVLLIVVTIQHNPWPTTVSLPVAALLLALIRLAYFGSDPVLIASAIVLGAFHELWTPLSVMAGAIFLFETMQETACLPYMMREMNQLSAGNAVAEIMLLNAFAYLVEGASGFGTPVALSAPMLVSSGHAALESVVVMLLFNSLAAVWGTLGISLWFGLGDSLDLSEAELLDISRKIACALGVASFLWVPWILTLLLPRSLVRKNLGFVFLSLLVTVGPSVGIAMINYEFPALVGGLVGTGFTAVLIRYKVLLVTEMDDDNDINTIASNLENGNGSASTAAAAAALPSSSVELTSSTVGSVVRQQRPPDNRILTSGKEGTNGIPLGTSSTEVVTMPNGNSSSNNNNISSIMRVVSQLESFAELHVTEHEVVGLDWFPPGVEWPVRKTGMAYVRELLMRTFPIWAVVLLLTLTRVQAVGIKPYLLQLEPNFTIQFGTYGTFRLSVSAVFQLDNILTYPGCNWNYALFYVPFILPFVLVSALTMLMFRQDLTCRPRDVAVTVVRRLRDAAIALAGAMALVQLMIRSGADAPAEILGRVLAEWFQEGFVVISPLLGALGAFFSGSATVSNLAFGNIQSIAAQSIGTSTTTMLALQSCGGSAGNGISLYNIIAACAVVGLNVGEGQIMMKTYKYVLLSTTTATVVMLAFFFRFDG